MTAAVRAQPTAADALAEVAARDAAVPGLAVVLDAAALGRVLGAPVRIDRVRYKAGTSIVAAVSVAGERRWVAAYANADKARVSQKRRRLAEAVPGVPHAVTGPAMTDRALVAALRETEAAEPALLEGAEVLRHNPGRRLILATRDDRIVKVSARGGSATVGLGEALRAAGVPVLATRAVGAHASAAPRWGRGDLAARADLGAARRAGAALAALHGARPAAFAGVSLGDAAPGAIADAVAGEADAAARAIATVLPHAAGRAHALAASATAAVRGAAGTHLIHGDLSADQVLVGDDGDVRLIDFDRTGPGDPARDLAGFAVDEVLRAGSSGLASALFPALLEGYRRAAGPADDDWRRWVPLCALSRAIEPFRRADADWPAGIERALVLAERGPS